MRLTTFITTLALMMTLFSLLPAGALRVRAEAKTGTTFTYVDSKNI